MLLRHKTIGVICLFLSVLLLFGALQYCHGNERVRIQATLNQSAVSHMGGDMAHDAVRSDVYAFLYAIRRGGPEVKGQALQELEEHGGRLISVLREELTASPSSEITAAIQHALLEAEDYVKVGRNLISAHTAWSGSQDEMMEKFNANFKNLESSMEKITELYQAYSNATDEALKKEMLYLQLAALLVTSGCLAAPWAANRYVFLPIRRLAKQMERMTNGTYDGECYGAERKDEIGEMAAALRHFAISEADRQALRAQADERSRAAEAARIHQAHTAAELERELKEVTAALADSAERLSMTSVSMSGAATRSKALTSEAEAEAERAAECVSAVAVSAEQLHDSAREIVRQIRRTNELVHVSRAKAKTADLAGESLSEATARIERVLDVVSAISGQINMLALNAGIESTKAGELGRGFAVVAGEVKNLANRTHHSIKEIKEVMADMRGAGDQIRETLGEIVSSVGSIADAAEEVSVAVEKQNAVTAGVAVNMKTAASGVRSVSEGLKAAGEASRCADEAAVDIKSSAGSLSDKAEQLERQTALFLNELKAA